MHAAIVNIYVVLVIWLVMVRVQPSDVPLLGDDVHLARWRRPSGKQYLEELPLKTHVAFLFLPALKVKSVGDYSDPTTSHFLNY